MGKKIVVVDDSTTVRRSLCHILSGAGYETQEAVDGLAALNQLVFKVDLIITDLNMPNMNGMELIRKVRSNGGVNKFTPILMLTTESKSESKEEGRAAGATGWIVKPFDPEKLLAVVEKVLR